MVHGSAKIERYLRLLKWMMGFNIAATVGAIFILLRP
jgi:hypothetical protein